jgi:hypothetical protein
VRAQQKAMPVVGYLAIATPASNALLLPAFHGGVGETGYVEGQNVVIEYRWAEDRYERLPALAADLVAGKVDVIVSSGGITGALAAKVRARRSPSSSLPATIRLSGVWSPVSPGRAILCSTCCCRSTTPRSASAWRRPGCCLRRIAWCG